MVFRYEFSPTNVTDAGMNNALILDFSSLTGTEPPYFLDAFVTSQTQPNEIFESRLAPIPISLGPSTIALSFSSFHLRASSIGAADFTALRSASFRVYFLAPSDDVHWTMQLDRVRFGSVPEPSTVSLIVVIAMLLPWQRLPTPINSDRRTMRCNEEFALS
jgi:hypothetical protein